MRILYYRARANKTSGKKTGVILRALERAVCEHAYLVPDGWRFILKMQADSELEPFYAIDVQSNRGGGDYAKAKMFTLENFPKRAATGGDNIADIIDAIKHEETGIMTWDDNDRLIIKLISELESADCLTNNMWLWLRHKINFAPCYGGIRIPFNNMVIDGSRIVEESGEIRIAFSGASAEQDLFFALLVFRALNDSFVELFPNTQGWLNLRELEKIPNVKFWLDLLGVKEA